jgi:uncharacterized membrane protein
MKRIHKSIRIDASVETVFEFLASPQNLLTIWPSLVEVKNVKRAADGAHSYDWTYKMAGIKFHGHASTVEVATNRRRVVKNEKGIPSTFIWTFEPAGDSETLVTLEVEYAIPGRVLRALAEPFITRVNEREAETVLANLKSRVELEAPAEKPAEEARLH